MTSFIALLVGSNLAPFGTVRAVSGDVYLMSQGIKVRLSRSVVGHVVKLGDEVLVRRGALVIRSRWGEKVFWPSREWQPLLTPLSEEDRRLYAEASRIYKPAVIPKGLGTYPGQFPVPCTLFTIEGLPGPYRLTFRGENIWTGEALNRPGVVQALLRARDVDAAREVRLVWRDGTVPVRLMPREEEASLLTELASTKGSLGRAVAFARRGLFEFARYELESRPDLLAGLGPKARSIPSVRSPL